MNTPKNMTPDSVILQQLEGHWQKMAMLILWKLHGEKKLTITGDDIKQFREEFEKRGGAVVYTHGHAESIDFQIVDHEAALKLQQYEAELTAGRTKHNH